MCNVANSSGARNAEICDHAYVEAGGVGKTAFKKGQLFYLYLRYNYCFKKLASFMHTR